MLQCHVNNLTLLALQNLYYKVVVLSEHQYSLCIKPSQHNSFLEIPSTMAELLDKCLIYALCSFSWSFLIASV